MKKTWTLGEFNFLKVNYPKFGAKHCSEKLGRSVISIKKKAQIHEIRKEKNEHNRYNKENLEKCVKESKNYSDVARNLGISTGHGNRQTIKIYIEKYNIDISHFDFGASKAHGNFKKKELEEILVENSTYYDTSRLKNKLYKEGLKERKCELCGQGEMWMEKRMSLILDHINGINNDNRIENLRIVCANCGATLPTHCRKNENTPYMVFFKKKRELKKINKIIYFCECGKEVSAKGLDCPKCSKLKQRKAERPPLEQLLKEVEETSYCAVGRKYGVSDNAIRKWIKGYEKDALNGAH